jgi:two-component system, NtrC family, sensor kinase
VVGVPLIKDDELVGIMGVYRQEVRPFADKQIELLTNFASQAVIAIENARLLNELRQRTTDLTEALGQQTATTELLQVVNASPGDLVAVFDAMLEKALKLCEAAFGGLYTFDGQRMHPTTTRGVPEVFAEFHSKPLEPVPGTASYALVRGERIVHIADLTEDEGYLSGNPAKRALHKLGGARTVLWLPLRKDSALVGTFVVYRTEVRPFTDKQIALLQNFATQAVIAMENTRLLKELRQRTDQVEKLNQQLEARVADQVGEIEEQVAALPTAAGG